MKKNIISLIIDVVIMSVFYYLVLPPINIQSPEFWVFVGIALGIFGVINLFLRASQNSYRISRAYRELDVPKSVLIPFAMIAIIIIGIILINIVCSPLFNAKSYSKRITIDETGEFLKDIAEVDFNSLPLLDRDSSEKLGDRVMGQMSELVSQYYVSSQYTQINYNNEIIRVTPLEYADFIKWISNRKDGVKGYITVNSVNGEAKLVKLDKGMKYVPSAHFNENLYRKLRFSHPTAIFGTAKFEIDNEGNPYFIVPTYSYTAVGLKTKVSGVIIFDPITGKSKKYSVDNVPSWVDNAYNADLIIEQVNDWGNYRGGFFNSIFGQKNVVNTTEGYNYLAMNDDIYLYTGITSVLSDESNLGFVLSNMRTGETIFYSVPGAEEYSAMSSAEGQVQQMKYKSTFPLLINLNNKPTYLVSLKDAAGLVKMYGFIDVTDYQKVVVTDASKGIVNASINYLNNYADEVSEDILEKTTITIKSITSAIKSGNSYYYITDTDNKKYIVSIDLSDNLPFLKSGDKLSVGYFESKKDIISITKIY